MIPSAIKRSTICLSSLETAVATTATGLAAGAGVVEVTATEAPPPPPPPPPPPLLTTPPPPPVQVVEDGVMVTVTEFSPAIGPTTTSSEVEALQVEDSTLFAGDTVNDFLSAEVMYRAEPAGIIAEKSPLLTVSDSTPDCFTVTVIPLAVICVPLSNVASLDAAKSAIAPPRTPQPRKRKVSIYDLMNALEKALEVKRRRVMQNIPPMRLEIPAHKRDITQIIKDIYANIKLFFFRYSKNRLTFSNMVPSGTKEDKIYTFIPLLHLTSQQKIELHQEKHFGEIEIILKNKQEIEKELGS